MVGNTVCNRKVRVHETSKYFLTSETNHNEYRTIVCSTVVASLKLFTVQFRIYVFISVKDSKIHKLIQLILYTVLWLSCLDSNFYTSLDFGEKV